MKTIVFSDIDGTLLNSEHKITPLTEQAIKSVKRKNIPFVIVSARSPSGIYPILDEYGFRCPIIAYSGALILDETGNILYHRGISKTYARKIITFLDNAAFDLSWCIYSLDEWIVKNKNDPRIIREETIVKAVAKQGSIDSITGSAVNKIMCICAPGIMEQAEKALKAAFPDCSIVKSSDILLEITENHITKATAIQTLCAAWNIALTDAIAFGDNYNDLEMLETVGTGILMGNAPDELKQRITRHTYDNDHDGIYHALAELGLS